jgi:hypothetical protein
MAKKVLKIIVNPNVDNSAAIKVLEEDFKVTVYQGIKKSSDIMSCNMVLFTDGPHVNPQHYTEKLGKHTTIDKDRDEADRQIYNIARRYGKLLVGFGRGAEFLNVMAGGKMIQHVNNHNISHYIQTEISSFLSPSSHTQMMDPYELPSDKYKMIAWSKRFMSTTYLDGNNDEIDLADDFLEPEIIRFENINALAFQGDPSAPSADAGYRKFVGDLINSKIK